MEQSGFTYKGQNSRVSLLPAQLLELMNKARTENAHLKSLASRWQEDPGEGVLSSMEKRQGKLSEGRTPGSPVQQGRLGKAWSDCEGQKKTGKGSKGSRSPC